jgi:hypothetical protein
MSTSSPRIRPPPAALLRRLYDHQRWLNTGGRAGEQFVGSELLFKDCDLDGVDFSKVSLEFTTFKGGSLKGARFTKAVLFWTTFDGCDIAGADFGNANLRWAAFLTNHEQALFEGADLGRTAWNRAQKDQNHREFFPTRGDRGKLWPRDKLEPK